MTAVPGVRIFSLDDAGEVVVGQSERGLTIERIDVATGWVVGSRFPDGFFSRRKPASAIGVTLRDGPPDASTREAELEIGRLDDGHWEIAQRRSHDGARLDDVVVGCGTVTLSWDGRRLSVSDLDAAPGWHLGRVEEPTEIEGGWDLVVVWTRGDADVELVVHCQAGDDPAGRGLVDIDRRERVAALS